MTIEIPLGDGRHFFGGLLGRQENQLARVQKKFPFSTLLVVVAWMILGGERESAKVLVRFPLK